MALRIAWENVLYSHLRVPEKVLDVGGPEHLLVVHPHLGRPRLDHALGRIRNLGGDTSCIHSIYRL